MSGKNGLNWDEFWFWFGFGRWLLLSRYSVFLRSFSVWNLLLGLSLMLVSFTSVYLSDCIGEAFGWFDILVAL